MPRHGNGWKSGVPANAPDPTNADREWNERIAIVLRMRARLRFSGGVQGTLSELRKLMVAGAPDAAEVIDRAIPAELLKKMISYRIREYDEEGIGWM